jgi:magnesium-transporting ATPase (P-type)
MLSADAVVIRDGKETKVPAKEVVPGDIVILNTGDRIPGDIRMIEVNNLSSLEAALTGESVPIEKSTDAIVVPGQDPRQTPLGDRKNMCFSATLVSQGYAVGIVAATGDYTEIGTINKLVNNSEEKKTAVLEQIAFIAKVLATFISIVAIITWTVAVVQIDASYMDALTIALTCAVAMIPEGLDAIVTMTYSWSVATMAKHNAIIRVLPSVETLGSVTTICSDKTGTLTKNEMSLVAYVTSNAHYKFDVDSKKRSAVNFRREDSYLAERAAHALKKSAKSVIQSGPSASRANGDRAKSDFGFSMHGASGHSEFSQGEELPDGSGAANKVSDPTPVSNGESPSLNFIRNALAGGVLCSKCSLGKDGGREGKITLTCCCASEVGGMYSHTHFKGEIGNPTELSILRASYFSDIDVTGMKRDAPILAEVPFNSEYKFMATVHEPRAENDGSEFDGKYVAHVKGAPDRLIRFCKYQAKAGLLGEKEPIDIKYWTEQIAILSSHGLRCLALCRGPVDTDSVSKGDQLKPEWVSGRDEPWLTIMGVCAIQDPPRPECIDAIATAHTAGVRVAMITGDHKDTALAIGTQLGIVDEKHSDAITGPEIDVLSEEEMKLAVMKYNVFARASPENKIQIVKALQAQGEVCSMTGDGVNDAPALKAADSK